jgi:hypothetical protein
LIDGEREREILFIFFYFLLYHNRKKGGWGGFEAFLHDFVFSQRASIKAFVSTSLSSYFVFWNFCSCFFSPSSSFIYSFFEGWDTRAGR